MKQNQAGFTLIEIAIVLVIIGLLLGGVLKGQELINSAKVKNLATDFRNIPVFIYGYQDKYKALPGDDAAVDAHLGGTCATTSCLASSGGTIGNGLIEGLWNSYTSTDESYRFWQHVRMAGLSLGPTVIPAVPGVGDGYRPVNAVGGEIGIQSGTSTAANAPLIDGAGAAIPGTYVICSPNILGKFAKQLDIQLDDGNTATGNMMVYNNKNSDYAKGKAATATASVLDADITIVCMGV
jgi:prepilin-type N-terminal cleavage/methylation domain-containing protein